MTRNKPAVNWTETGQLRIRVRHGYTFLEPEELITVANLIVDAHDEYELNGTTNDPSRR